MRRELIDPKTHQHEGRIFKTTGDGILIELPSGVEAAACAVALQRQVPERLLRNFIAGPRPPQTPPGRRIMFYRGSHSRPAKEPMS